MYNVTVTYDELMIENDIYHSHTNQLYMANLKQTMN